MDQMNLTLEVEANRLQLAERIARSREPRVPTTPRRHRLARGLRRVADRLEV